MYVSNNQVLGSPIVVYSAEDSRKGSFDINVPSDTDLDDVTSVLMNAINSVEHVVADPAPAVQATALTDDAITLSASFWYPSTRQTGATVVDGVIRATMAALQGADIALAVLDAKVTEVSSSTPASKDDNDETATEGGRDASER